MKDGPYRQAVVINYNRPPDGPIVQGNGSAIFMHIGAGQTAGCVSMPRPDLETVMRTLRPHDRIIMGTQQALFR
jgi:L,D-peptidoglycan transpeptidase YkuD (ErfK/YbiS/YcfS/YnhG family)